MAQKFSPPKGTRDFLPDEMAVRHEVFARIERVFRAFGYGELDTPAFEALELLTVKSGSTIAEEIYTFRDKGGRDLALRFEFTSSLGRVAASNPQLPRPFKRYQIGKVWRYERPQAGRFREFYQADADVIGSYSLECEIELLALIRAVLGAFALHDYTVLLFNRKVLDALVIAAGVAPEKSAEAFRALDKYHKIGADGVREEFSQRGLEPASFDKLAATILLEGGNDAKLAALEQAAGTLEQGRAGIDELRAILNGAAELGMAENVKVDTSLVRGLDYYTGPIMELRAATQSGVGSFGGGGRYDSMVQLFGGRAEGAVGFSFGVERLIEVLRERNKTEGIAAGQADVFVAVVNDAARPFARKLADHLRAHGLRVAIDLAGKGVGKQFQYAEKLGIKRVIPIGPDEAKAGSLEKFPVKDLATGEQREMTLGQLTAQ